MLKNIAVILVEPLYSGNIGSVARAIKNMGMERLILVNPRADHRALEAIKMAVSADDILEKAEVYTSFDEAVGGFSYLAATTVRDRKGYPYQFTAKGIAPKLLSLAKNQEIGILFGREDKGLFNEELCAANDVITIPTSPNLSSLNLAQAVLLVCYEIYQALNESDIPPCPDYALAPVAAREGLFEHLHKTTERIGFFKSTGHTHLMYSIRDLINRALPSDRDVRIIRGMLREIDNYIARNCHDDTVSDD